MWTCEPDLTCVAVDFPVLCPEQLPNAVQGEPYSSTATFNLPPSVVDPGSGLEATLLTVTILGDWIAVWAGVLTQQP